MLMTEYLTALERRQLNQKAKSLATEIRSGQGKALNDFVELVRSIRKKRTPDSEL